MKRVSLREVCCCGLETEDLLALLSVAFENQRSVIHQQRSRMDRTVLARVGFGDSPDLRYVQDGRKELNVERVSIRD